jgi:hypothetical protein
MPVCMVYVGWRDNEPILWICGLVLGLVVYGIPTAMLLDHVLGI